MSSNIRITKRCEYCRKEYEARRITTKYCSHGCNSRAYKQAIRETKVRTAVVKEKLEPKEKLITPIDYTIIQGKELLTINEASFMKHS